MITLKQILLQICPRDWFMSLNLKDAYFHIQVAPPSQTILRFAFEGVVVYLYKVLPFGLSLAPHTFKQCMDKGLSPLQKTGIRILNYLDNWLILAQSEAVSTSHKTLLLSHLCCLGLRVNFAKSILSPSQRLSFLGTVIDSVQMTATVSAERATMIQRHAASFKKGTARPLKALRDMLVPFFPQKETPCASTLRQQVRGVIHESSGRTRPKAPLQAGEQPSCVGSDQSALTEGKACSRQK